MNTYPTFENPVPLSHMMGARTDMVCDSCNVAALSVTLSVIYHSFGDNRIDSCDTKDLYTTEIDLNSNL